MGKCLTKGQLNKMNRVSTLLEQINNDCLIESGVQHNQQNQLQKGELLKCGNLSVPLKSIEVSQHAHERAIIRFSLKYTSKSDVVKFIHKNLIQAEYIGQITDTEGNDSHFFVRNKIGFHLSLDLRLIYTVIKIEDKIAPSPINDKVKELIHKEFRKLDRKEKAELKKFELFKREANYKIAEVSLRKYKTKSLSVKMSCEALINALQESLQEYENNLLRIKTDKRKIAYSLASCIAS